jgi:hypothetical protein
MARPTKRVYCENQLLLFNSIPPPKQRPPLRRFLVKVNWQGEVHEYWRHTRIKDDRRAQRTVILKGLIELSKKVGYGVHYIYQHICDPNARRYEVNEQ